MTSRYRCFLLSRFYFYLFLILDTRAKPENDGVNHMNEEFKKKIKILIVFFGCVLLIMLIVFLLMYSKNKNVPGNQLTNNSNPVVNQGNKIPVNNDQTDIDVKTGKTSDAVVVKKTAVDDVAKIAASFVERFGTYSNQSDFSNMVDLHLFMTEKMRIWSDGYVADMKKTNHDVYYGITTKAVTQEIRSPKDDLSKATVMVKTRRREATTSIGNVSKIFNQDATVELVKVGDEWKIDSIFWEEKE